MNQRKQKKTKKYITKITDEICLKHRKSLNQRNNIDNNLPKMYNKYQEIPLYSNDIDIKG